MALTGILLARPEDQITKNDILPHLKWWHYRSDFFTDFFCAGYVPKRIDLQAETIGLRIDDDDWAFSLEAFGEIVESIETQTGWRYNGDPCLILTNCYFDGTQARLDFKRSIRINFRQALDEKVISSPTDLADAVFYFAKTINEGTGDPIWELSDTFGRKMVKKGLKEAFLAWLPEWSKPTARAGFHFFVHEIPA